MRFALLALLGVLTVASDATALRIATYNVLNYTSGRTAPFETVVTEIDADVIVAQEVLSQTGVNNFLAILNTAFPGEWSAGPFLNGPDTDNAIFYRAAACSVVSHFVVGTTLRDIDEYTIRPKSHTTAAADLRIYVVHLKASQGGSNEQRRLDEVTAMRTRMETFPAGQSYIVAGDFNIYQATEPAYQYMINAANGAAGVVQDPISREGNWHNNSSFADVHTQSPRVTQFGGGANGGMDDRFDLMLVSPASEDGEGWDIFETSYTAFGQDGQHYNGAINVAPFTVVTQPVAQAIHDASDHLPVFADWQVPARLDVLASLDLGTIIVGGSESELLFVENVAPLPADELDYSFSAPAGFTAPAGSFQLNAGAGVSGHSIGLDGSSVGFQAGSLVINNDDPDDEAFGVLLTGTVLDHAEPSALPLVVEVDAELDLGAVAPDTITPATAQVYNVGFGALRALLEVYDATLTGDPRFSLQGFAPQLVGGTPADIDLQFDASGAADGPYSASLTLSTRDEQLLSGALDRSDITFDLSATVSSAVDAPVVVAALEPGLRAVAPNPFRASTEIRFALTQPGRVELRLYDVAGRRVRDLVSGVQAAGERVVTWDGRDEGGRLLAPGIYFARFQSAQITETRKIVRVR